MNSDQIESGWRRFLDRLKQLWGKTQSGDVATASTAVEPKTNDPPGLATSG